ncbi:hypothetical protein DRE_04014 [Drechslerella stenobrocha 248]|uniref:Uncharacterized protein n=1 Tax=Drechslerella stenobrocha 248 TaxID=1043628 RepID=W7HTM3_9PEZI|nr:hypothetical protein DRE_04014 [Drechslerella stenobrocha 248]
MGFLDNGIECMFCDWVFCNHMMIQKHQIYHHAVVTCLHCGFTSNGLKEYMDHSTCCGINVACDECGDVFHKSAENDTPRIEEHLKNCQAILDPICGTGFYTNVKSWKLHCDTDPTHTKKVEEMRKEKREQRRLERERELMEEAAFEKEDKERRQSYVGWDKIPLEPLSPRKRVSKYDKPEFKPGFKPRSKGQGRAQQQSEQRVREMFGIRSALEPKDEYEWPDHMISPWAMAVKKRREEALAARAERQAKWKLEDSETACGKTSEASGATRVEGTKLDKGKRRVD